MTKASSCLSPSDPRSAIARRGKLTSSVRKRAMANLIAAEIERNQNEMQRKQKILQKRCEGKNRLLTESRDVENGEGKRRKNPSRRRTSQEELVRFGKMKSFKRILELSLIT